MWTGLAVSSGRHAAAARAAVSRVAPKARRAWSGCVWSSRAQAGVRANRTTRAGRTHAAKLILSLGKRPQSWTPMTRLASFYVLVSRMTKLEGLRRAARAA